jgi:multiple antibiotic resistance protein
MNDFVTHLITIFMGFFAIMNPIANTAVFAGLTTDNTQSEKAQIAAKALAITFIVILMFSILGKAIFHMFSITLPALRITGGILVFLVGYHMLNGKVSTLHTSEEGEDIAVSPLAMPLLAGPGTIATAMNYSASGGFTEIIISVSMFTILCIITFLCFKYSSKILEKISENTLGIITRLMGLILAVMGTQMVLEGLSSIINISFKN